MNNVDRRLNLAIITVHKGSLEHLLKTLNSIDKQTIKPKKHIIVCRDESITRLNFLKKDYRIFIINKDKSIYHAMNIGIKEAKNLHKLFLNSNDTLFSNFSLQRLEKYIKLNIPIIAVTALKYKKYIFTIKKKEFEKERYMPHSSFISPMLPKLDNILFKTNIEIAADGIWMKKIIEKTGKVIKIYNNISLHTLGGISTSPSIKTIFFQLKYKKLEGLKELLKFILYSFFNKTNYYLLIYKRKYKVKLLNDD